MGLHLKTPDKIKAKFVDPALTYVKAAEVVAKDIWRIVKDSAEKAYNFVVEIFKSDEADESEKDDESEDAPSKKVKKPQPTKPRKSAIRREDMEP